MFSSAMLLDLLSSIQKATQELRETNKEATHEQLKANKAQKYKALMHKFDVLEKVMLMNTDM